jgi:hypothetical protein
MLCYITLHYAMLCLKLYIANWPLCYINPHWRKKKEWSGFVYIQIRSMIFCCSTQCVNKVWPATKNGTIPYSSGGKIYWLSRVGGRIYYLLTFWAQQFSFCFRLEIGRQQQMWWWAAKNCDNKSQFSKLTTKLIGHVLKIKRSKKSRTAIMAQENWTTVASSRSYSTVYSYRG